MLKIKITFDSIGIQNINYDAKKYKIVLTKTFIIPFIKQAGTENGTNFFPQPD